MARTSLLDLPVELILLIFSFVDVNGAENLVKLDPVRHMDPDILENKVKQYRHIRILSSETGTTSYSVALSVLWDLKPDSGALRHVRSLEILEPLMHGEYWHPKDLFPRADDDVVEACSRAARKWSFVRLFGPGPFFTKTRTRDVGKRSARTTVTVVHSLEKHLETLNDRTLLAANLPNLEHLRIVAPRGGFDTMLRMRHQLLRHPDAGLLGAHLMFSRLRTLSLLLSLHPVGLTAHANELARILEVLNGTAGLESLQTVILDGDGYPLAELSNPFPSSSTSKNLLVRRLELRGCNIWPRLISRILWMFPHLREFVFERRERWPAYADVHSEPKPRWCHPMASLVRLFKPGYYLGPEGAPPSQRDRRHTLHTEGLQQIRIRFESHSSDVIPLLRSQRDSEALEEISNRMFSSLNNLRELDVSASVFCTPGSNIVLSLAKSLPPQVETLTLHRIPDRRTAWGLFRGLSDIDSHALPRLGRVVLSSPSQEAIDYVVFYCKSLKSQVVVVKEI